MGTSHHKPEHLEKLLRRLIESGSKQQYHLLFQKHHEADIAEALEELLPEERTQFFNTVNPELAAEILEEINVQQQLELITQLKTALAAKYIEEMDSDDAVDLLEELEETDPKAAEEIIDSLPKTDANTIKTLMSYEEETAGSLMTSEYIEIPEDLSVKQTIDAIKKQTPPESESSYYIFVTNKDKQLLGYTTLRDILISAPQTQIKNIRNDYPITLHYNTNQEDVALAFQKYNLGVIPVTDENEKLHGVITVDDVVDVVVEEATEDIYKLSGTVESHEEKLLTGNPLRSVQSRLPWLLITITGGIIASYIITTFSAQYSPKIVSLALALSFVPLLMGLGGNVGNQSATIIVRGIATGHIKDKHALRYIFRELFIGLCIGIIISGILLLFNINSQHPLLFSITVSIALLCNITTAAIIGSSLPILLKKLNIDPAVASAPFISTALDIIGQLIYFALTLNIIRYL